MKKICVLLAILSGLFCGINAQAQSTYYMYAEGGGGGEYLNNLKVTAHDIDEFWGIHFTSGSKSRGFVNNVGRWGFVKPDFSGSLYYFSNWINNIKNLTIGCQGWMCAEGVSVRQIENGVTNTLDLLTTGNKSTITSNGDSEGLHIRSTTGRKIYLYDDIYFDQTFWTKIGSGRNDDPTIDNTHGGKWLRLGSSGGMAFWGKTGVETDDHPQLTISGDNVKVSVPLKIQDNDNVSLYVGTSGSLGDGWIGTTSNAGLFIGANNGSLTYLDVNQKWFFGLNKTEISGIRQELKSKYRMFVEGGILSTDYSIAPVSSWSDFVFNKDYKLRDVEDVESYIKENKHLPDVPSAEQVAKDGYSQHEMNKVLLQKIEELTLYTIQQQKEIETLKAQLSNLNSDSK